MREKQSNTWKQWGNEFSEDEAYWDELRRKIIEALDSDYEGD